MQVHFTVYNIAYIVDVTLHNNSEVVYTIT